MRRGLGAYTGVMPANPVVTYIGPAPGGGYIWNVDGVNIMVNMPQGSDPKVIANALYGTAYQAITVNPNPTGGVPAGSLAQLGPPQPGSPMAIAQTVIPSVSEVNLSRPGAAFQVGDQYMIAVNGAPNQAITMQGTLNGVVVQASPVAIGVTDSTGNFQMQGTMGAQNIGAHSQIWYVGGVASVPLVFTVSAVAPASSTNAAAGGTAGGRSAGTQPQAVNQFGSVNAATQTSVNTDQSGNAVIPPTSTNAQQQQTTQAAAAPFDISSWMPLILVGAGVLVLISMGRR